MLDPGLRPLTVARDYASLHQALRDRRDQLGLSIETMNQISGLSYAAKLLSPLPVGGRVPPNGRHHGRALGATSLGPLLGALGCALIVAEDPVATARLRGRSD